MTREYEIKLLGIEPQKIREFLEENSVEKSGVSNFRRVIFDVIHWTKMHGSGCGQMA